MEEDTNYDAIVAGAGISGLLTALALSKEGKKVLIIEKSDVLGGNCRTYEVNGYHIDTGPHAITGLDDGPLQILMDKYFDRQPEFVPIGNYYVRDGKDFQEIPFTVVQLANFSILSKIDRMRFLAILIDGIASSSNSITKHRLQTNVYDFIKSYGFSTKALHYMDALAYFLSGKSMQETPAWRMLGGYGGLDEKKGQSIKSKRPAERIKKFFVNDFKTHGYPMGGLQAITDALLESMPKDKVAFRKNEEVKEIITDRGRVTGVKTDKGSYASDLVIYSGFTKDLPKIVKGLENSYKANLDKIEQSHSMVLWLGLKEKMPEFSYVGSEVYFNTNTPYWAIPITNYDPDMAPKGKQLVGFMAAFIEDSEQKQLQKLRGVIYKAIPEIKSKIEFEHIQVTIPEKAAITINGRFPSPKSPIDGLYLVGTDTDTRSMGVTRASYSVLEALKFMREDGVLK